jgi:hypothetical protein
MSAPPATTATEPLSSDPRWRRHRCRAPFPTPRRRLPRRARPPIRGRCGGRWPRRCAPRPPPRSAPAAIRDCRARSVPAARPRRRRESPDNPARPSTPARRRGDRAQSTRLPHRAGSLPRPGETAGAMRRAPRAPSRSGAAGRRTSPARPFRYGRAAASPGVPGDRARARASQFPGVNLCRRRSGLRCRQAGGGYSRDAAE